MTPLQTHWISASFALSHHFAIYDAISPLHTTTLYFIASSCTVSRTWSLWQEILHLSDHLALFVTALRWAVSFEVGWGWGWMGALNVASIPWYWMMRMCLKVCLPPPPPTTNPPPTPTPHPTPHPPQTPPHPPPPHPTPHPPPPPHPPPTPHPPPPPHPTPPPPPHPNLKRTTHYLIITLSSMRWSIGAYKRANLHILPVKFKCFTSCIAVFHKTSFDTRRTRNLLRNIIIKNKIQTAYHYVPADISQMWWESNE